MKKAISSTYFRIGLGVAIGGLCLFLAVRKVEIADVKQVLAQASAGFVALALLSVAINILAKILRWKTLFGATRFKVRLFDLSLVFLSAQMLNALLPARIGEISRVAEIGKAGAGYAFALGTIAIEKALDMLAYALLFLALVLSLPLPGWMGDSGTVIVALAALIIAGILIVAFQRDWVVRTLERGISRLPARAQSLAAEHLLSGLSSLDVLQSRVDLLKLAFWSAVIWGAAVATNYLLLLAFELRLPAPVSLLLLIALQAGVSIPALPGKIGIFEYICVISLELFAISHTTSLSYGILLHAVVYLPIIITGLFSFWLLRLYDIHTTT
ncbi:MAG: flippase-like domain-containing protein [Anaerolineales bacterium]|nr:flippase-like domain-containing protein [Anaerolineales bacterium]